MFCAEIIIQSSVIVSSEISAVKLYNMFAVLSVPQLVTPFSKVATYWNVSVIFQLPEESFA